MSLRFNFSLLAYPAPHGGRSSYADLAAAFEAQLADLGHTLLRQDALLPPPAINLVMEGFDKASVATLLRERRAGKRMVVVATEMPTCATAHGFLWNNRLDPYWAARAITFPTAAPLFDACWALTIDAAAVLRRYVPDTFEIELGYSPRLLAQSDVEPAQDFCFFGSKTDRRAGVISELRRRGHSVEAIWHMPPAAERDKAIDRSRVVLDIKPFAWWPVVSSSRISTALHRGRPVVCEPRGPQQTQAAWKDIGWFARSDESFPDEAAMVLAHWRAVHVRQMASFRRLTAEACLAGAIAGTEEALRKPPRPVPAEIATAESAASTGAPRLVKAVARTNLVEYQGKIYAVPQAVGNFHVDRDQHQSVKVYGSIAEAERALVPLPLAHRPG